MWRETVIEQMAARVSRPPTDNPALIDMIRKAVNDALNSRGVQIGAGEPTPPP